MVGFGWLGGNSNLMGRAGGEGMGNFTGAARGPAESVRFGIFRGEGLGWHW